MDSLPDDVSERMHAFSQGDVLPDLQQVPAIDAEGNVEMVVADEGVVIVSQTCDVVQDRVLYVHVAPRITLSEQDSTRARGGRWIRYVPLPAIGPNSFADAAHISAVHKSVVSAHERLPGVSTDDEASKFGKAVGRHFSRFAFPDEVSGWLDPLSDAIRHKAGNLNSPEGRILENVVQFRVESLTGWAAAPFDLRLIVVLKPAVLPTFANDELPPFPEELQNQLYTADGKCRKSPGEIAERIENSQDPATLYWLWAAIGDAWAAKCKFKGQFLEFEGSVTDMTAEVLSADEFTLTMQITSEILDLDHLSDSRSTD